MLSTIFIALVIFGSLVYWVMVFVILYHLTRFGIGTQPKKIALVFLLGTVILFFSSLTFYFNIDKVRTEKAVTEYTGK